MESRRHRAFASSVAPAHARVWTRMAKNENGGPGARQIMARFRANLFDPIETDRRRFDPVCARCWIEDQVWAPFGERGALHHRAVSPARFDAMRWREASTLFSQK
jgi:hypothetical protein